MTHNTHVVFTAIFHVILG